MSARHETLDLMQRLGARGISLSFDEANTLRRAEKTLHRWAELECGDDNGYCSFAIERDEQTGIPYMARYPHGDGRSMDKPSRYRIPDRERGALHRVRMVCLDHGLHYYHQTDPRGCALYLFLEPLKDHDYSRGVACCA